MIPSSYERKVPPVSLLCWSCSSSLSFATLEWLQIMLAVVHREPPRARDHGDFTRIRRSCIQILCIHVRPTSPTARGSMGANCGTPIGHCNCTMDTPIRFGRMRPRDTTLGLTILRICTSDTVLTCQNSMHSLWGNPTPVRLLCQRVLENLISHLQEILIYLDSIEFCHVRC